MDDQVLVKLAQVLGIDFLRVGKKLLLGNNKVDIQRYWVAQILFFDLKIPLIVGNIKGNDWQVGILLLDNFNSNESPESYSYTGMNALYPVDLSNWHDPVTELLHSMDSFPYNPKVDLHPSYDKYIYHMMASTWDSKMSFTYKGNPRKNDQFLKLWLSTIDYVNHVIYINKDEEIGNFVNNSIHYRIFTGEYKV